MVAVSPQQTLGKFNIMLFLGLDYVLYAQVYFNFLCTQMVRIVI